MPYLVKMQAEQTKNQFTSSTHTIGKGLGASLLCLSLLAGCASSPEQEQAIDSTENTIKAEDVTLSESGSQSEKASTETQTSNQTAKADSSNTESASPKATTEPTLTTEAESQTAPDTTTEPTTGVASETIPGTSPETSSETTTNVATTAEASAVVEESLTTEEASTTTEMNGESMADANTTVGAVVASEGAAVVDQDAAISEEPSQPLIRSSKNLGKSYGIWTLKDAGNGFCKLKTPTLQIGNKDYSSQIWMDIEEQQIIVNAYMALDIEHPKTGIQIDDQALIPFAEKVNSTRAIVSGDMTTQLSAAKELHIFINGKEVGKQVLKRNVKLTNMNAAITALRSCSN